MTDNFPDEMFRNLVENLNAGVMIDDSHGKIHYANRAFTRMFKLQFKQLEFFDFADLTAPENRNELLKLHLRRLSGKTVPDFVTFAGIRTDGSRVSLEASVSMLNHADKVYFLTILRDVSEKVSASAACIQNRNFEMSHRISQSIFDSSGLSDRAKGLRDKLHFPDSNVAQNVSWVDPGLVVLETAGFIQEIGNSHANVSVSVDPDIPRIHVSKDLLRHVLRNSARNALESLDEKGKIILRAGYEEKKERVPWRNSIQRGSGWVFIEIKDNGSGMTEDVLARAPEPFFTTKQKEGQGGMGLFEVFQGMRVMSGYASLSSVPESGTLLRLFFPCERR